MVTERSVLTEALIEVVEAPPHEHTYKDGDVQAGYHVFRPVRRKSRLRRAGDPVSTVSAAKLHLGGIRVQGGTSRRTVGGEVVAFVRERAVRRF
jgi:hypothetical protein